LRRNRRGFYVSSGSRFTEAYWIVTLIKEQNCGGQKTIRRDGMMVYLSSFYGTEITR
jgi:hypothetical protein